MDLNVVTVTLDVTLAGHIALVTLGLQYLHQGLPPILARPSLVEV